MEEFADEAVVAFTTTALSTSQGQVYPKQKNDHPQSTVRPMGRVPGLCDCVSLNCLDPGAKAFVSG